MIVKVVLFLITLFSLNLNAQGSDLEELQRYEDARRAALKSAQGELQKFQESQKAPGTPTQIPTHGTYPQINVSKELESLRGSTFKLTPSAAPVAEAKDPMAMSPEQMASFFQSIGFPPEQAAIFINIFKFYNSEVGIKFRSLAQNAEFKASAAEVQKKFILRNFLLSHLILFMLFLFYKAWSTTPADGWFFRFVNNTIALVIYMGLAATLVPYILYGKSYLTILSIMYKTFG